MKRRIIVDLYRIDDVKEPAEGGRDNIVEQTDNQLNCGLHRMASFQADDLRDILPELKKYATNPAFHAHRVSSAKKKRPVWLVEVWPTSRSWPNK